MKPECHHPPFVVNLDESLPEAAGERLVQKLVDNPTEALVLGGFGATVTVVECSWCRRPENTVDVPIHLDGKSITHTFGRAIPVPCNEQTA